MSLLNRFVGDILRRLLSEALDISRNNGKRLTTRVIESAVHFLFPEELAKHAIAEGRKTISQYNSSSPSVIKEKATTPSSENEIFFENDKKKSNTPPSRTRRAGLIFSVGHIHQVTRAHMKKVCHVTACPSSRSIIYIAAVMEYMCAEILELSGYSAKERRRKVAGKIERVLMREFLEFVIEIVMFVNEFDFLLKVILPFHIEYEIRYDKELSSLLFSPMFDAASQAEHTPYLGLKSKTKKHRYKEKQFADSQSDSTTYVLRENINAKRSKRIILSSSSSLDEIPNLENLSIVDQISPSTHSSSPSASSSSSSLSISSSSSSSHSASSSSSYPQQKYKQSGYLLFLSEKRREVQNSYPSLPFTKHNHILGKMWKDLRTKERDQYCERAKENGKK